MRIVGGRLGGRRLKAPKGNVTRPTSERVREAIASALEARGAIAGKRVLDLYAGTGALGFEALSRGATHVVFGEKDARTAEALTASAEELGVARQVEVVQSDVTRAKGQREILKRGPYSLVFADPPYREVEAAIAALHTLTHSGLLADEALLLLEHSAKGDLVLPSDFVVLNSYRYGDTAVELFAVLLAREPARFDHGGDER